MMEKEPHVTPAIRLPQLPLARKGRITHELDPYPQSLGNPHGTAPDEQAEEIDEDLGDEENPERPLRSQISGDQPSLSRDTTGLRSVASGLLRRALLNFAEQERQRTSMLLILLVAQVVALLLILPGYLFGQFQLTGTLMVLGGLALFGTVWLVNWLGKTAEACYLLVLGGGGFVVLDLLLSAAQLLSIDTLYISVLFLLVILSSGILFSPETALILAGISSLFSVVVLLVFHPSAPLVPLFQAQGRYLPLAYLVIAQLGVGVVAWLFGRQMQESVHLITYVAGLEMTNKRLHKRLRQTGEKKRNLEAGLAIIQQTHARVAAGDYAARAHVEGDLLPLAVSLNLMLERVESFVHGAHERERMETAVAGLAELAGKVGGDSMGQLPVPTGTALDGLSIAIKQMQTNVNQRLGRVQQAVTSLMTTVGRCQDGLLPVAEVLEEHLRSIDALALSADNVMNSAQRQLELAERAEQLLLISAPAGIELKATVDDAAQQKGTSALRLAEELERRVAQVAERASFAVREAEPQTVDERVSPEQEPASAEPEDALADEPVAASEQPAQDQSAQPEAGVEQETTPDVQAEPEQKAVDVPQAAAESPETELEEPVSEEPAELAGGESEQESASEVAAAPATAEAEDHILADIGHEVSEEPRVQEPGWNIEQLQELARLLSSMAGEATLQGRNARTMNYKLRAMLQGLPDTRRVDMMAVWLRAVLEAVTQSANQVRQASKALPVSAFSSSKMEGAEPRWSD